MRTVFALCAEIGLDAIVFHWDIIGAYLWSKLDEEIYMEPPPGCKLPKGFDCLLLIMALYGLKQSGRLWYKLLTKVLLEEDFVINDGDACLLIHLGNNGKFTYLCIHVDDLFGFTTEPDFLDRVRRRLDDEFEVQENPKPDYILGIQIVRDVTDGSILLHQRKYVTELLEKFNMVDCHPVRNPADSAVILCAEDDSNLLDGQVPYREAVGALLYAAINTGPVIAFAVSRVAKFVQQPRESHWTAVKRIMRFLKGKLGDGIKYTRTIGKPVLTMYCDADYAADIDSRKSTTGYVGFIANGPVAWRSTSQKGTALSTCVAELYALTEATVHTIWYRDLLKSLGHEQKSATKVHENNQAAIAVCENNIMNRRVKCVGVRLSFMRDQVTDNIIELIDIASAENTADIFTKALPAPIFEYHAERLMTSST